MTDSLTEILAARVAEASADRQRPDTTSYRSLSFDSQKRIAEMAGTGHKQVQLAALQQGIIPEVYARNQKSLSCQDQVRLLSKRVAVIGLGGLGGAVTEILARIGIGGLTLVDGDRFDDSNLNRQLLSSTAVLGKEKALIAAQRVAEVNPAVEVRAIVSFLDEANGGELLDRADIVVDCLDSIADRFVLEQACRRLALPLASAAIGGTSGQVTVIFPEDPGLAKIYGDPQKAARRGVERSLGTLPFAAVALAAMECAEVVAIALCRPGGLRNRLLFTDLFDHHLELVDLV
jgi:molybdopterin/thiamine biosynthesis adenylyltransferase